METYKDLPMLGFATTDEWQDWLENNHASAKGIWIKYAKKGAGVTTISYEQSRDLAIAYGWIDGQLNALDAAYYLRRFSPRGPKSGWSKINRGVAEGLIAVGTMRAAGLAQVAAAKADGRWELAYDSPSKMGVPEDFQAAMDANPAAAEYFATLKSANRYAFLYRLQTSRPEVRPAKIERFIGMLEQGASFHPEG